MRVWDNKIEWKRGESKMWWVRGDKELKRDRWRGRIIWLKVSEHKERRNWINLCERNKRREGRRGKEDIFLCSC